MPTKLSQFTNDPGYPTSADIDTSQNHTHANKGILDTLTQAMLDKWNTVSNKVDKVSGKGLSTNDFTAALLQQAQRHRRRGKQIYPPRFPSRVHDNRGFHPPGFLTDFYQNHHGLELGGGKMVFIWEMMPQTPRQRLVFLAALPPITPTTCTRRYISLRQARTPGPYPKYIRVKSNGAWGSWSNVTVAAASSPNAKFYRYRVYPSQQRRIGRNL